MILTDAVYLLITPPGSLIYHLSLATTISLLYAIARLYRSHPNDPGSRADQWCLAASGLLFLRLILLTLAAAAWLGRLDPNPLLPVLDRFVQIVGLIVFSWVILSPLSQGRSNILAAIATFLTSLGLIATFLTMVANSGVPFNKSSADAIWGIVGVALALTITILAITQRPIEWQLFFGAFCLLTLGHTFHLSLGPKEASLAGFVRWSELAAYPLITMAALRTLARGRSDVVSVVTEFATDTSRQQLSSLLELSPLIGAHTPEHFCEDVARVMARVFEAEVCLILTPPDANGEFSIAVGYDLRKDLQIPETAITHDRCPILADALSSQRTLTLSIDSQAPDSDFLKKTLRLESTGPTMLIPLIDNEDLLGAILLISTHGNRSQDAEEQETAEIAAGQIARRMQQLRDRVSPATEETHPGDELSPTARARLEQLERDNIHLLERLQNFEQIGRPEQTDADTILLALYQEAQATIRTLEVDIEHLKTATTERSPIDGAEQIDDLTARLRATEQALKQAEDQLLSQKQTWDLSVALEQISDTEMDVITSIARELRRPMSSVMGYTDLLLSESVGLLGAMQRNFLDRVRNGIDRMRVLLDNLVHVPAIETGSLAYASTPVDIQDCLENVITHVSGVLRDKNLALRIDVPEQLPLALGNRDVILQIITHLINNAIFSSPQGQEIIIAARVQHAEEADFLMLTFSDAGEGVSADDLGDVFKQHGELEGAADQAAASLPAVHRLIEAMGGRVWFDSNAGFGNTFTVLIPTVKASPHERI